MALNDISLTAGMRNNLVALQSTAQLVERTQTRLSTGKKVNTALDNPTNFFAAQTHTQRASDLSNRKDGMAEAIQGVQAADKGITAVTSLIEAAKGLTQSARASDATNRDVLAGQFNTVMSQITQLASDSGYKGKNFLTGDSLNVLFNEDGSNLLTINGFTGTSTGLGINSVDRIVTGSSAAGTTTFTVGAGSINTGTHSATLGNTVGFNANTGYIFAGATGTIANGTMSGTAVAIATGMFASVTGFAGITTGAITIAAIYVNGATGVLATTDLVTGAVSTGTWSVTFNSGAPAIASGASIAFDLVIAPHASNGATGPVNMTVFDMATGDTAGGLEVLASGNISDIIKVSGQYVATGSAWASGTSIVFTGAAVPPAASVTYRYNSGYTGAASGTGGNAARTIASLQFTGQALAAGQTITAVSLSGNALGTGSYTVNGRTITLNSNTTGLNSGATISYTVTTATTQGGWETETGIDTTVDQLNTAVNTLRTQSASLASSLNIVTVRQDFTQGMINTLLKGADNLTLADMNEEGANMLMLQTRQQLGTTTLSQASQAAQSVLRLF